MRRNTPAERTELPQDASPQVGRGHGHTELSNELLEAAYRFPFTGPQLRLVLAVIRDSYGWKRKVTLARTVRAWADEVGIPRATMARIRRELDGLAVLEYDTATGGLRLVKNYLAWGATPQLPFELSTPGDKSVDNFTSTIGVPLVDCPTGDRPTGEQKRPTGERQASASGTHYGERKERKKERGAQHPAPQLLPNGKTDTPTARAELGHWEFAPQDHPGFTRLSFKLQDTLADQWRERAEEQRKRTACKKCATRPRAGAWPYCRPCTVCSKCEAVADGHLKFTVQDGAITCANCKEA